MKDPTEHEVNLDSYFEEPEPPEPEEEGPFVESLESDALSADEPEYNLEDEWDKAEAQELLEEMEKHLDDILE